MKAGLYPREITWVKKGIVQLAEHFPMNECSMPVQNTQKSLWKLHALANTVLFRVS